MSANKRGIVENEGGTGPTTSGIPEPFSVKSGQVRVAILVEYIGLRAAQTGDLTVRSHRGPCLRYYWLDGCDKGIDHVPRSQQD